jgi:indoleamine 2,3-dioxygenase
LSDTCFSLGRFGMVPELGFLGPSGIAETALPASFDPVLEQAGALSDLLTSDVLRQTLAKLPDPVTDAFLSTASDAQLRAAMVRCTFLVQAYVWGRPDAAPALPASLARPVWRLAQKLGTKPLLIYANYVLDNWALIDPDGPIALGNIRMVQKFLGGRDEAWFVLVHVAIEAKAGGVLALFPDILKAASEKDSGSLEMLFSLMNRLWDDINAIFDRMPESCDPYIYFNRVRPYIHGWKDNPALPNGIIYEGVVETCGKPQAFRGQTGSQSSIVPSMDALFGIGHEDDPLKAFLDDLHAYRPVSNRAFIDALRAVSNLRETVRALGGSGLIEGCNANIRQVARFRTRHLEYAASYIHKQAKDSAGNDTDVGTGGTPFMKYLKKHRDESEKHLLPMG